MVEHVLTFLANRMASVGTADPLYWQYREMLHWYIRLAREVAAQR